MSNPSVVDEYAIWLAHTGVTESVSSDMNEGCDPISKRGGEVSDEDWLAAMALAGRVAAWIQDNPEQLLALVRAGSQETTGATS